MDHSCCSHDSVGKSEPENKQSNGEVAYVYTCPMHPEVQKNRPGMCPECGMALVPSRINTEKKQIYTDKHKGHKTESFLRKFWLSLILTLPLVAFSELPNLFLGKDLPDFPGLKYLILFLGSIVFFYGGWGFLAGSFLEL